MNSRREFVASGAFAVIVNRKTAAALGIAIPQSVLLQVTEVIE
jgi:hypothetical protein